MKPRTPPFFSGRSFAGASDPVGDVQGACPLQFIGNKPGGGNISGHADLPGAQVGRFVSNRRLAGGYPSGRGAGHRPPPLHHSQYHSAASLLHRQGGPFLRDHDRGGGGKTALHPGAVCAPVAEDRLFIGNGRAAAGAGPRLPQTSCRTGQNFELSSIARFPQVGQAMVPELTGPPHLSQNCASGSATIAPHVLRHRKRIRLVHDRQPHRLQNFDSPSGAGIPRACRIFWSCVSLEITGGRGIKPVRTAVALPGYTPG